MIKAVLFDLDGTLLPMDQDMFLKTYFKALVMNMAPHGYDPKIMMKVIGAGTMAMIDNDGTATNEEVFWSTFGGFFNKDVRADEPIFTSFYREKFICAKEYCGYDKLAKELVETCKEQGFRVVLATNPLFPSIATQMRMGWAGFVPEDFELYTTYENSNYCKPNLKYYQEILTKLDLTPEECVMIGNDVSDDMVAKELGMKVFLLTNCLINKDDEDISQYPNGGYKEAIAYIKSLTKE